MRILAWGVAMLAIGCGGGRERAMCNKGGELCLDPGGAAECAEQVKKLKEPLGDKYDTFLSCGAEAGSCMEALGCAGGLAENIINRMQHDFDKGAAKMK